MATTLTTRIEPTVQYTQLDFTIACAEKSIALFDTAIEKKKEVSGWDAPLLALREIGWGSLQLCSIIAFVVADILIVIGSLFAQNWSSAAYRGLCVVIFNPLLFCAASVGEIISIFSSLFVTCSSTLAIKGWRLAEQIELASFQLVACAHRRINPAGGIQVEHEIYPREAITFFGEQECVDLDRIKKPMHELRETETKLVRFVNEFAALVKAELPPPEDAENAKKLYDANWRNIANKEKMSDDVLTAIKNIEQLIADYFAFGKMSYRFCYLFEKTLADPLSIQKPRSI
jgi:hypothetical protein